MILLLVTWVISHLDHSPLGDCLYRLTVYYPVREPFEMCGLTAFLRLGRDNTPRNSEDSPQTLGKQIDDSLELVKHRGPDARGQWLSEDLRVGMLYRDPRVLHFSPSQNAC